LTFSDPSKDHKRYEWVEGRVLVIGVISGDGGGRFPFDIGKVDDPRAPLSIHRPIVAFDFDGTLTTRDSFTAFLRWRAGPGGYAAGLIAMAFDLVRYMLKPDRGRLKAAAASRFLGGASRAQIDAWARSFAESQARRLLRPDAVRAWKYWREKGARLVIVTASPEELVAPFARGLGADLLLGTRLAFDEQDRFAGRLDGENCRGEEKVRRLREALGEDMRLEAAYGDTDGDRAMLAIAEEAGYRVFSAKPDGPTRARRRPRRSRVG
jgi:phosphatidylglycerophosphatase C